MDTNRFFNEFLVRSIANASTHNISECEMLYYFLHIKLYLYIDYTDLLFGVFIISIFS